MNGKQTFWKLKQASLHVIHDQRRLFLTALWFMTFEQNTLKSSLFKKQVIWSIKYFFNIVSFPLFTELSCLPFKTISLKVKVACRLYREKHVNSTLKPNWCCRGRLETIIYSFLMPQCLLSDCTIWRIDWMWMKGFYACWLAESLWFCGFRLVSLPSWGKRVVWHSCFCILFAS